MLIVGFRHFNIYLKISVLAIGVYHFLFAFINPQFLKATFFITSTIGNLITKIFLALFFYLVFTPIALILRISGKDEIKENSIEPQWQDIDEKENDPKRVEKLY